MEPINIKKHLTSFQIIILALATVILCGAALLMLPVSSQNRTVTPFNEALFTSTSAVCVTGLVVRDTASYWSLFGQGVILALIQIGGVGVVTVGVSLAVLSGKKISLMQRSTVQESVTASDMSDIARFVRFIVKGVVIIELLGALVMTAAFCGDFGLKGIWMSVFHSVSAFCNAGFDITGTTEAPFTSLTAYSGSIIINVTVMLLIIIGGIGFMTWDDIRKNRLHFKRYSMQSKVIFTATAVLIAVPAVYFFLFEFKNLPAGERILTSLFQSVTPRTAGFNTADLTAMSGAGKCVVIMLMLIGGAPGSTAGGMKITTAAALFATLSAVLGRSRDSHFFGRRINDDTVKKAAAVLMMYLTLFIFGALIISTIEGLPIGSCLFETASAVGTVGLSLGITTELGIVSQCILITLMFIGRVGGLTLVYAFSMENKSLSKFPLGKIAIG